MMSRDSKLTSAMRISVIFSVYQPAYACIFANLCMSIYMSHCLPKYLLVNMICVHE